MKKSSHKRETTLVITMQKRNLILELTNSACIQSYMDNVLSFKSVIHTGIVIVERKKIYRTEQSTNMASNISQKERFKIQRGKGRYMCDLDEVLNVSK